MLAANPNVAQQPKPQVGIAEFGEFSVNLGMRYWVPTGQFYEIMYQVNDAVYAAIKSAGITIPFPQREVRMIGGKV